MRTLGLIAVTAVMATVAAPAPAQVDCIIPRHDEAPNVPRSDPVLQAARKAEEIILERGDFIATLPEPIRLRSSLVIENRSPRSAHLQVQAFPKSQWKSGCSVITTIVGATVSINVYINTPADETVLGVGILRRPTPQRTGEVAGRPTYNGLIVLTRDGKLPLVPETVKSWMDREEESLQKLLADAQRSQSNPIADLNLEMWKRRLAAYRTHRGKLSAAELAAPWGRATAEAEREWAPRIKEISQLPPAEQQQVDARAQQSRSLERQAVVERTKNKNPEVADRLRDEAAVLNAKNAEVLLAHRNKVAPDLAAADEAKKLAAIKGVVPDRAGQWTDEPGFFDTSIPNRIHIITVGVGGGSNSAPQAIAANNVWVKRVMDNIDYEALSKLLN